MRQRQDPFWDQFGGIPRERVEQSLGSGAIVRPDGVIVTNHHVVEGMEDISVVLMDRRQFPAKVLLDDQRSDLAVLKIDVGTEKLPTLSIDDRETIEVGDLVLAIGNPFGVGQTVTNGIVSALSRTDIGITDYSFFIQTDAAINPGNSGGPLVDMDGDLIGLNTAIFSRSGSSSGVGFAIPAKMVRQVVDSAMGGRRSVERPWLGAKLQPVDADAAKTLGLPGPRGLLVKQIYPGSVAQAAGLREGDVVLDIDGQAVNDESSVSYRVGTHKVNDAVLLRIRRGPADRTLTARAAVPPSSPPDERVIAGRNPLAGATIANLSPAEADAHGLDPFKAGVFVAGLEPRALEHRRRGQPAAGRRHDPGGQRPGGHDHPRGRAPDGLDRPAPPLADHRPARRPGGRAGPQHLAGNGPHPVGDRLPGGAAADGSRQRTQSLDRPSLKAKDIDARHAAGSGFVIDHRRDDHQVDQDGDRFA